jgi:ATP-binding cassette subfamily F protein uup
MAPLLTCLEIAKAHGSVTLFQGVSFTINENERHGLIGPNGAGKSTLLHILGGDDHVDSGEVAWRKGLRLAIVEQDPTFDPAVTVQHVLESSARTPEIIPSVFGLAGFRDPEALAGTLSGGWRKRLAIAQALVQQPDLLLLDEPTNHLDIDGIVWLEETLSAAPFSVLVVSHDRYFLENAATHVMELHRLYPGGLFRVAGNYSRFLEEREEWFETREKQREALAARVRREVEWLRRGAKARTRKAKARLDSAAEMIRKLEDLSTPATPQTATIDFTASDRKTKRLVELENVSSSIAGRTLFEDLSFTLAPGRRLGLAGPNGSGKTTLLRLLRGELAPTAGAIRRADFLKVVYFDQNREAIDPALPLRRALAPEGDSVIYRGRPIHVNGWAKRFLFREEQLVQPVASLSGGERARIHIARLMLQEADLLLLDEPTNDLDIPTLEVLQESLADFPGAMVLVTHDRYLMDAVTNGVLGLDGDGGATLCADLAQWDEVRRDLAAARKAAESPVQKERAVKDASGSKKRLSYLEQREWDAMEGRILEAEAALSAAQARIQAPDVISDPRQIELAYAELTRAQSEVDSLYARWSELEAKVS